MTFLYSDWIFGLNRCNTDTKNATSQHSVHLTSNPGLIEVYTMQVMGCFLWKAIKQPPNVRPLQFPTHEINKIKWPMKIKDFTVRCCIYLKLISYCFVRPRGCTPRLPVTDVEAWVTDVAIEFKSSKQWIENVLTICYLIHNYIINNKFNSKRF